MNRFFSKLDLRDIKIDPEATRFPPDGDEEAEAAPVAEVEAAPVEEPVDAEIAEAVIPASDRSIPLRVMGRDVRAVKF